MKVRYHLFTIFHGTKSDDDRVAIILKLLPTVMMYSFIGQLISLLRNMPFGYWKK